MATWTLFRIALYEDAPERVNSDLFESVECPEWATEFRAKGDGPDALNACIAAAFAAGWCIEDTIWEAQTRDLLDP